MSNADQAAMSALIAADSLSSSTNTIGERSYLIEELSASRTTMLIGLLTEKFELLSSVGFLEPDFLDGLTSNPMEHLNEFVPMLAKVWGEAPEAIARLLGILLIAPDSDDMDMVLAPQAAVQRVVREGAYIMSKIKLRRLAELLGAAIKANPAEDILRSFFRLGDDLLPAVAAAQEEQPATS